MKNLYLILIVCLGSTASFGQTRVTTDLLNLYTFQEGSGSFVHDVSSTGEPVILRIHQDENTSWLPEGGLQLTGPTLIRSLANPENFHIAAVASNELSLEAWVIASNSVQEGPARIVTVSSGSLDRNATLGQSSDDVIARLRTTETSTNGTPELNASGAINEQLQHIVYTRQANGNEVIYIDGEIHTSGVRAGDFSNWNSSYHLALGNEIGSDRPWLGTYKLVATYGRALEAEEVQLNFLAGPNQPGATPASELCATPICQISGFGAAERTLWIPNLPNDMHLLFEFDEEGGHFDVFEDGTAHMYGNHVNMEDENAGFYMDFWFTGKMNWEEWSALGRSWKGADGIVGDLYETWDYFIMDPDQGNVLIGTGNLEGSVLNCTHRPSDYTYGLQVGLAANDQNAEPGLSCWFDYSGTVSGEELSGNGDINLEGSCEDVPVLNCAVDVEFDCISVSLDPEVTGVPVIYCEEEYTLSFEDNYLSEECPIHLVRTWTATASDGSTATCEQTILVDDNEAPVISGVPAVLEACDLTALTFDVTDNCDENPTVTVDYEFDEQEAGEDCNEQLRTQTMGGWGSTPNGNNPGMYLQNNFATAFPNGITIGCENTLTLTSAQAVQDFLPSGSTPTLLPNGAMVDPGGSYTNVLAGQLMAATISLGFDNAIPSFGESDFALGELSIQTGEFQGWTVAQIVEEGNALIGGCASDFTASQLNNVLSGINESYVDGEQSSGFLGCSEQTECGVSITAIITAEDACGNVAQEELTVFVEDNEAPIITVVPENITVNCNEIPEPSIDFEDGCFSELVELAVSDELFSGACLPTIQRTYTLVDPCGNTATHIQYITVIDEEAPVFVETPEDLVLACGEPIPAFSPEATDNCSEVSITLSEDETPLDCGSIVTRTWTAIDECGNATSVTQQIVFTDTEGPYAVSNLEDMDVSCDAIPPTEDVEFADACSEVVEVTSSDEQVGEGCTYEITRTFEAVDACGNTTVLTQILTVTDTEAPVFVSVPEDIVLECGASGPDSEPVVQDLCSSFAVIYDEVVSEEEGTCAQVTRTWTAVDACGNESQAQQIVTYIDTEAPVLVGIPESGSASCGDLAEAPVVTANDNCDSSIPVFLDEQIETSDCQITVTRTWTATDLCGNTATAEQLLVLIDETAPSITGVPNVTVECNELQTAELIVVEDDCQFAVNLTYVDEVISGDANGCNQELERTWIAQDACGNEATFVQLITVIDETGPSFTFVPENIVLSCVDAVPSENALAEDACSQANVTLEETWSEGTCGNLVTRVWTATDGCGNVSIAQQVVEFLDQQAPEIVGNFESLEVDCAEALPAIPAVEVVDNCANAVDLVYSENTIEGNCPSNYSLVRTWVATDACGNQAVATQTIEVSDTTPPVFDFAPEDITAECGTIPTPPVLTATDNCSTVSITYEESFDAGGCPNIYRTWTATDACGNATQFVQTVFIEDTEPPLLIGIPENIEVDCNTIPEMPEPEVSDNCDEDVALTVNQSIVGSGCEYTIIRTWIASDDCGNTTIASQSILVEDTEAPVFVNAPTEMTVECDALDGLPFPEVFDDCGNTVNITFEDVPLGEGCSYDVERTYTATDLCGQSATATMIIHVVDTTPPVISGVGPNTFVNCDQIPAVNDVVAFDSCGGEVPVTVQDTQIGEGCSYIISRTYFAEDACENITALTQLIYVEDASGPSLLGVPEDVVVDCNAAVPAVANVGALDNCDEDVAVNFEELIETTDCSTIYTRIWTATDNCGNQSTATQQVIQTDLTAPALINVPENVETTCDAIPEVLMPMALDACDDDVAISFEEEVIPDACPYEIRRTFVATDACGNESIVVQQIFVLDEIAPVFVNFPEDLVITCDELGEAPEVLATDDCTDPFVYLEETWSALECGQLLNRTWTAVDDCGNVTTQTQQIELIDNEAPVFTEVPSDLVVSCIEVPAFEMLPYYDACGVSFSNMEEVLTEGDCPTEYSLERIWTIMDACGQTTEFVQQIEVIDNIAPLLMNVPENVTVDCSAIPEVPVVSAYDGCGEEVEVNFAEEIIFTNEDDDGCFIDNASNLSGSIALWLPGLDGIGSDYVFGPDGGDLSVDPVNGELVLSGEVYNTENPNFSWMMNIRLGEERTWDEWSALGRDYKDDLSIADDHYQDWKYYILNGTSSQLIGTGELDGSMIFLSHAPADSLYGFQLGMNANNHSEGEGLGGWFFYGGTVNGESVYGHGDIFTENDCCPEHEIIRTWTATDCAGNTVTYTQVITVTNEVNPSNDQIVFPEDPDFDFTVMSEGGESFLLAFEPDFTGPARIEVYDLAGNQLDVVKEMNVLEGAVYSMNYTNSNLPPGVYVFTVAGNNKIKADRGIVLR